MGRYATIVPGLLGKAPALTPVTASDVFFNEGETLLHIHNGNGASCVVTLKDRGSVVPPNATSVNDDVTVTIPAGQDRYLGPFLGSRFNDASGLVTVQYSVITGVTAEVVTADQLPTAASIADLGTGHGPPENRITNTGATRVTNTGATRVAVLS